MNDNALRAPQWRQVLGEFMPRHLGGTPEQWAEANRLQFPRVWHAVAPRMAEFTSHDAFQREYDLLWFGSMCSHLGIPMPPEPQAREIVYEATKFITANVRADYPDAVPAIRSLHATGFVLHTASGTRSWELDNFLRSMGVRQCFGSLFGPDLVDIMKGSPEYYRRVFERARVEPSSAVVIDDDPLPCTWAEAAGATTIRVDRAARGSGAGVVPDLATAVQWVLERRS